MRNRKSKLTGLCRRKIKSCQSNYLCNPSDVVSYFPHTIQVLYHLTSEYKCKKSSVNLK